MQSALQLLLATAGVALVGCGASPTFAPFALSLPASVAQIEVMDQNDHPIGTISDPIKIGQIIATLNRANGPTQFAAYTFPTPQYVVKFSDPLHSNLLTLWVGTNWIGGPVGDKEVLRTVPAPELTQIKTGLGAIE